jgi:HAD superfamily hydrolase (TIGR01509 family)
MIIIIPLNGIGQRFKDNNYVFPKALINVCGKEIIFHLLDNLNLNKIEYVYIPYNQEYKKYNFENIIKTRYPHIIFKFYCVENNTKGAAETINIALNYLNETRNLPVICIDCDNFYLCDIISKWNGNNIIFTFKDIIQNPIYSYVEFNNNQHIINIKEKDKISDYACTGAYGFNSIQKLKLYTTKIIEKNITQKNEFYISCVIKEMINDSHIFNNIEIKNKYYFSLGTPKQISDFEHPFIFDLDGTLVDTDNIYLLVWNDIMNKYNLSIDNSFFKFFIQGKSDILFLKEIFPNINNETIIEITKLKDDLFIKYLSTYNNDIMIKGAFNFINYNKNRKMGIVTSSNKKAAKCILKKTNLNEYMQFLIASEDCVNHKPNKEPYQKAIKFLNIDKNNCTIFEDSNSGYKSIKSLGCPNICLIINNKSDNTVLNLDEYKIENYDDFIFEKNNNINNINDINYSEIILQSLNKLPINKVKLNNKDIKTGYICDIKSFTIYLNNNITENIILKIENIDNELSNVAREINLYNNETYFYDKLSSIINICIPKYYGSLIIDKKQCILLENLNKYSGEFNINLNNNIEHILSIIRNISNMHNYFYFKNEDDILPIMKNILKINEIQYYKKLIENKFNYFLEINKYLLSNKDRDILNLIYNKYNILLSKSGEFPLNFCHGDLKSPNIFYKKDEINNIIPVFLDWQYIHLNKGISDIAFLLVESTNFDSNLNNIIIYYYYKKSYMYNNFEDLIKDFKISLCIFPFFVMIWFNSENRDNLLDKVFPIRFMKNLLKFYDYYLDKLFFEKL